MPASNSTKLEEQLDDLAVICHFLTAKASLQRIPQLIKNVPFGKVQTLSFIESLPPVQAAEVDDLLLSNVKAESPVRCHTISLNKHVPPLAVKLQGRTYNWPVVRFPVFRRTIRKWWL
jgi:hypothetical protein